VARLDTLHVAALPYPTTQGTQVAIGEMVAAEARAGRRTALLTYRAGAGVEGRFEHLVPRGLVQPRSLRSGPSLEKVLADVELAARLVRLATEADLVIAHHVEAAALALAIGLPRWAFVAHTVLGPELPTYLGPIARRAVGGVASRAGEALDSALVRRAPALGVISPDVGHALAALGAPDPIVVPVPMQRIDARAVRTDARAALDLAPTEEVVLYAGNLDAYQGLPVLADAMLRLATLRPRARLLVASESSPDALARALAVRGLSARFAPVRTEADRARAHAAADVLAVPRGTPGGFPIKILDAMARGTPVVAMERARSGFALPGAWVCADHAYAFAEGLASALASSPEARAARIDASRAHLASAHGDAAYLAALAALTRASRDRPRRRGA
jgi:glycosyltransferase involved in cell wall biosynthesis